MPLPKPFERYLNYSCVLSMCIEERDNVIRNNKYDYQTFVIGSKINWRIIASLICFKINITIGLHSLRLMQIDYGRLAY